MGSSTYLIGSPHVPETGRGSHAAESSLIGNHLTDSPRSKHAEDFVQSSLRL